MIDYTHLIHALQETKLSPLAEAIPEAVANNLHVDRHGDLARWLEALDAMPTATPSLIDLRDSVTIGQAHDLTPAAQAALHHSLRALIPWRKGPFQLFDTLIDTEWRSDWKWDRVKDGISALNNRTVLDVGCGSGYHCWRMYGAGAARVIGIDPSPRFVVQFHQVKKYIADAPVDLLPMGIEAVPANLNAFDTTFSMGVLYHRRSPIDHLRELKDTLRTGGELVLETLIVDGPEGYSLMPEKRYAKMNNVWFLPSIPTLELWLRRAGFKDIRCIDINTTRLEEQRSTEWMEFLSLKDFLDPEDSSKTCEGYPAPKRAVMVATKAH
ncbi:tRNA 5-methoxyuridine(34)/uridine 5-oxyacetic acid(34) synthase CmoB [Marinagarivorans algicola]|uniref:tRNA 5-methoxyuridine(34)/uridine 5-oxyacetic acid(34) synthase CmoB n=1 Tax=Marinagarivorans algicola TaxID=1513270 RepID=UPI0006B8D51B|nr:tRNA 5-methoxyuridine(34)/uridine 5-oxyacetic acid(34) synthase CmoB [Marinagarivorans algicola]